MARSVVPARPFPRLWGALLLGLALVPGALAQPAETGVRGVWITNVGSDVLNSKEKIAEAMDYLKSRGFNVVFPVVWNKGFTLYPSEVMATTIGEAYKQDPFFAGQRRDPLAEIVAEARRVGLEVIPWFEFGFSASFSADGGHILAAKPEWAAKDLNGNLVVKNGFDWMDALNPEVQDFMTSMILEVVENYDVDGIQGDDRLPAMPSEGGYSAYDLALYKSEHGGADPPTFSKDNDWLVWRAGKLTNYLGRLYRTLKAIDENLLVSMSPSPYSFGFTEYLQNVPRWVDSSYVDLLHPQLYRYDVGSYKQLVRQTVGPSPTSGGGYVPMDKRGILSPGVLTHGSSGTNGPAYLVEAVRYNREFGITGEVFFYYEYLREKNEYAADSLYKYFYNVPAILPGRTGLRRPPGEVATLAQATLVGTWTEDDRAPGFDGLMRFAPWGQGPTAGATATYTLEAPYTATYDVYAFVPRFRSGSSTDAYYAVANAAGDSTVARVDQRSTYNQGFVYLTSISADAGTDVTVTLRPDQVTDERATYADAVMMVLNRKASPDVVVSARNREAVPVPDGALRLGSVRPMPSSGRSALDFTLAAPASVRAQLYDVLGRAVRAVADGQPFSAGAHTLPLDLDGLAAGTYFVRVEAGGHVQTAPVVVVR